MDDRIGKECDTTKKKWLIPVCAAIVIVAVAATLFLLSGRGDVSDVKRFIGNSALYNEAQINEACSVVEKYFAAEFEGCTLVGLAYDKNIENRFAEEIARYKTEKGQNLIVLLSIFTTDKHGGDGSFNPDDIYTDWQWYLVRTADQKGWEIVTCGY